MNAAKHDGMKRAKFRPILPAHPDLLQPPAYPKAANEVIRALKRTLDAAERPLDRSLELREFGRLIGAPRSTIHDWYHGELPKPMKYFLCAMERLSEPDRVNVLRELCRDCPRLDHPRLTHDQESVAILKSVIQQLNGLTLVVGLSDELRTFVMTAIGNSAVRLLPLRAVTGLDVHRPDMFVPVPGVFYFPRPDDSSQAKRMIEKQWPAIERSVARLVILNGVWTLMPGLQHRIEALASRKNVVVAAHVVAVSQVIPRMIRNKITIAEASNRLIRVHLDSMT